jgi:hypothetical protein
MTAARTVGGPAYLEMIEEMDRELTKVIEDFDRAVNVEALHRTKETGKYLLSQCAAIVHSQSSHVEQELLLRRLKHVETGYNRKLRCMEGTREFLLNKSLPGRPMDRRRRMEATHTGSTACPESARRRWLIRSLKDFTIKSSSPERFSAGEMTQI